ncbi:MULTISPECIES: hypothetical protein [unclassified Sulfurospirillum]|uniref:hypothetical protein n=1 Tax=unclassified Sulfurospirillum TaxID=2618290 RepID=UPI000AC2FE13|nr:MULTISPECIES: hypothetical protein [unclassified Sulfurospirillum]
MKLKPSLFSLLALGVLMAPLSLSADVDFEWRLSLNNRYHSDPHGYRYGLADRFRMPESRVIVILDSVREPADAYMIFRLAELSGKPYDYVLSVYRQNQYLSWAEIASLVGVIISSNDFNTLRHRHDLRDDYRYDSRRQNRYEDKRVVIKREEIYIPQVYHDQQQRHSEPKPAERHDNRKDDHRDDRKNNTNHPDKPDRDDDRRDGGGRH